jgi:hypothetical protein
MEFFEAGAKYRERCMMAANRVGKTLGVGGYETAAHLTGAQADDLRAGLEVAKWGAFCHSTTVGRRPTRFKTVCSDSAAMSSPRVR